MFAAFGKYFTWTHRCKMDSQKHDRGSGERTALTVMPSPEVAILTLGLIGVPFRGAPKYTGDCAEQSRPAHQGPGSLDRTHRAPKENGSKTPPANSPIPAPKEVAEPWVGAKVTVPALYMAGDRDLVLSFRGMDQLLPSLKQFVPDFRDAIILPGCGHWSQKERATEVGTAIVNFLAVTRLN